MRYSYFGEKGKTVEALGDMHLVHWVLDEDEISSVVIS